MAPFRMIALSIYLVFIGTALAIRFLPSSFSPIEASANLAILGPILFAVGIADYLVSLWLERHMLRSEALHQRAEAMAVPRPEILVGVVAIAVAAMGASPAIYALVLSFFPDPASGWFWPTLIISVIAFGHHLTRWEIYEEALRQIKSRGLHS